MVSKIEKEELRGTPAEYRVRIFLSVDLSGSTAFKNSDTGQDTKDDPTPKWVRVFQKFYDSFPERFNSCYLQCRTAATENDSCPELWKAVGDELVFCGRVTSQKSAATALSSFIETLHAYRKELSDQGLSLNLKGAAWLAAFPEPNRAVHLRRGNQEAFTSATEELECAADMEPFNYDFLGKAIDTGFRVASKATPEKFLLSVQAARLILNNRGRLGFAHDIRFEKPEELKGVNHGEPYPKLFIDTMDHLPAKEVRRRERQLLNGNANNTDHQSLLDYLNDYCSLVGTDDIALPLDDNCEKPEPPESYLNHKEKILAHFEGEKARAASQETGATHEETSEQEETLDNPDTLNP